MRGTRSRGTVWAAAFVLVGYLAGSQYRTIEHDANYAGLALLVAVAAVLVIRHRRSSSKEPGRPEDVPAGR